MAKSRKPVFYVVERLVIGSKTCNCTRCGTLSKRHSWGLRRPRVISQHYDGKGGGVIEIKYAKYHCLKCQKYFSHPMDTLVAKGSRFTRKTKEKARKLLTDSGESGMKLTGVSEVMRKQYGVYVPISTLHDWQSSA